MMLKVNAYRVKKKDYQSEQKKNTQYEKERLRKQFFKKSKSKCQIIIT